MNKIKRYADKDLEEFRVLVLNKLIVAERNYDLLKSTTAEKSEFDVIDSSSKSPLNEGEHFLSREENTRLLQRQFQFIQNLKSALKRIENKTYGICRITGKLIPKERLRAVPHATLSIEAKNLKGKKK
ncbi:MAG: TraR/DksA C4-type zinc finger protein [Bacteroidales bacterium OttesenSCG-928-I14]|jgi:RNA polymerase-binding transcription factor DksA|nr:TraR/DksA C4-type zinc finger protein [Bacteroidales bacterium OttesenSCG-928-I14]